MAAAPKAPPTGSIKPVSAAMPQARNRPYPSPSSATATASPSGRFCKPIPMAKGMPPDSPCAPNPTPTAKPSGKVVDRDGNNEQPDLTQCRAFRTFTSGRKVLVRKRFVQPSNQTHSQKDGNHCDACRYRSLAIPCFGRVERGKYQGEERSRQHDPCREAKG
jgi:hypothetical protein